MATELVWIIGGTDGLMDGTVVDADHPIPLRTTGLNTPLKIHFRAQDDATGLDNGDDSTAAIQPTCPTGVSACFTVGGSYVASPTADATIATGGNSPLWVQQTARQAADANLSYVDPTWATGSRVAQGGTITITPSATQLSCALPAVSGADGYQVQYKLHADSTWLDAADVTDPSVITGLTAGSSYDVRYRAFDERGYGAWSATATASTLGVWTETFANLAAWTKEYSGSLTPTTGTICAFAGLSGASDSIYSFDTPGPALGDFLLEVDTVTLTPSSASEVALRLLVRASGTNGYDCYFVYLRRIGGGLIGIQLWDRSDGTEHALGTEVTLGSVPSSFGIAVTGTGTGTRLTAYVNGSPVSGQTNLTPPTHAKDTGKAGFYAGIGAGSSNVTISFDNFKVTQL